VLLVKRVFFQLLIVKLITDIVILPTISKLFGGIL
jgi:hypothetical protein